MDDTDDTDDMEVEEGPAVVELGQPQANISHRMLIVRFWGGGVVVGWLAVAFAAANPVTAADPKAAGAYDTLSERAVTAGPVATGVPVMIPMLKLWAMAPTAIAAKTAPRIL
jgi:hypothetical protein